MYLLMQKLSDGAYHYCGQTSSIEDAGTWCKKSASIRIYEKIGGRNVNN